MSVFRPSAHALITGGASGVGYAVAQLCLKHSMRVSIVDSSQSSLDHARKSLFLSSSSPSSISNSVTFIQADVSSRSDWASIRQQAGLDVDFLMLNAGIGGKGTWGDEDYFDKILATNLGGVVNGLNAYVPSFKERAGKEGMTAIVITGSKQGITNPPGNPAYNASKAAVKTLAEHLSYDLKDSGVGVHLLVPGWTFTGLSGNEPGSTKAKPEGAWSADQVADYMYAKMQDKKFYIICPDDQVTEETDKKRMLWSVGDIVNERPPLTRWREEYKEEAEKWMAEQKV
ncbi:putative secondary metabolism biosynthetic enzyme [Alternaria ventricosa]|uniref:putative secondary metabolism biosynthetic enzyme n=1 Tax=Alternaria ventricosa TaxID=1187951 RepID=UPI0020C538E1|nr:putative secondary metabolism biosynthetic enzyme [Alternaria ventricosa]KAI4638666.1 putative secondary metabolism biosynthetic enzyme [Alternaria ventricosa]